MFIHDIKSPIRKAVQGTTEKIIRYYRRVRFFVKISKYGIPIVVIIVLLFSVTIIASFPDGEKAGAFYLTTVTAEEIDEEATPTLDANMDTATPQEKLPAEESVLPEPEVILPNIDGELAPEGPSQEPAEEPSEEGTASGGGSSPSITAGEGAPTEEVPGGEDIDTSDEKLEDEVPSEATIPPKGEVSPSPAIFTNSQELLILKFVSEGGPPELAAVFILQYS